jgi:hypothetical protein
MRSEYFVRATDMGVEPARQDAVSDDDDMHTRPILRKTAANLSQVGHEFLMLQAVSLKFWEPILAHEVFFSPEMQADIAVKKGQDFTNSLHASALMAGMNQMINLPEQLLMLIVDFFYAY